jgi:hypothetical protein
MIGTNKIIAAYLEALFQNLRELILGGSVVTSKLTGVQTKRPERLDLVFNLQTKDTLYHGYKKNSFNRRYGGNFWRDVGIIDYGGVGKRREKPKYAAKSNRFRRERGIAGFGAAGDCRRVYRHGLAAI